MIMAVVAQRVSRRDAHLGTLFVSVNARTHEIELPTKGGLFFDERIEFFPSVFLGGILFAIGLDANDDARLVVAFGQRIGDGNDGLVGGVDERRPSARFVV